MRSGQSSKIRTQPFSIQCSSFHDTVPEKMNHSSSSFGSVFIYTSHGFGKNLCTRPSPSPSPVIHRSNDPPYHDWVREVIPWMPSAPLSCKNSVSLVSSNRVHMSFVVVHCAHKPFLLGDQPDAVYAHALASVSYNLSCHHLQ